MRRSISIRNDEWLGVGGGECRSEVVKRCGSWVVLISLCAVVTYRVQLTILGHVPMEALT